MTTIVFSTSGAFVSRAIAWFTKSKASHVMISTDLHGVPVLLHCTAGGVQITPRAQWFKTNRLVAEFEFAETDTTPAIRAGVDLIGVHYDYLTLFGWGAVILLWRWFKLRVRNPLSSPTAMVCSEFVLRISKPIVPEWLWLDPEATHCQDLLDTLPSKSLRQIK